MLSFLSGLCIVLSILGVVCGTVALFFAGSGGVSAANAAISTMAKSFLFAIVMLFLAWIL